MKTTDAEKSVMKSENDQATQDILETLKSSKKTKEQKQFKNVSIERNDTDKIILPEGMSFRDARVWLERIEKSEETVVKVRYEMKAYPWDGAYALFRAMETRFGYAAHVAEKSPSGDNPPQTISVRLPDNTYVSVPWGHLQFPGLDAKSYLDTGYDNANMKFIVTGEIKKKYKPAIDALITDTELYLKEHSLYKGNAIRVDLAFLETGGSITQPEFLNQPVSTITREDVLLTKVVELDYSSVLLRIQQTDKCRKQGIPLKHGCLLAGPYGTGKTLLAKYTASVAIQNGWTFIYLDNALQLKNALRLAEMYAPAIVFAEDIDKAVEGASRTTDINSILNTLDGIDTKTNPIITILTTNHLENINKAFLRAGRIDSLIKMGPLQPDTAKAFLDRFARDNKGKSLIDTLKYDYSDSASALSGIVPAFAYEVINKAKMYAMYHKRELLLPEDISIAAASFKEHIKLTTENTEPTHSEKVHSAVKTIFGDTPKFHADVEQKLSDIKDCL